MMFDNIGWFTFLILFALFAKSLWFFYYFTLYTLKEKKYPLYKGKVALIVPAFNESEAVLTQTIKHVKKAKGLDQVIFVNDGSSNNVAEVLKKNNDGSYQIVDLKKNVGKRRAQYAAIKKMRKDIDVLVFMDSDTLLQKNTIRELTRPMNDPEVGGATACILVSNSDTNILTKSIASMYWTASNIWRKAPSKLGYMQVTNGQLSCYQAKLIRDLMPQYISQMFMGVNCTLSDDRYITHHLQVENNKKIVYAESAVVYTTIPESYKAAYKMFLRWKLGSLREAFLILNKIHKKPLLVIDIWANHLVAFFQTVIRIAIIIVAIYNPWILLYYLVIMSVVSLLFAFDMLIRNIKELPYRVLFSIMDEIYFRWVFLHALLTINRQGKWGTR